MKISTLLASLLIINSSVLAGHLSIQVLGNMNPIIVGGIELGLGFLYYVNSILKDVRNAFDVDVNI